MRRMSSGIVTILLAVLALGPARAQSQFRDPGTSAAKALSAESDGKLKLSFETRVRLENKTGNSFGKEPDRSYGLFRNRLGLAYRPVEWFRVTGTVQDSRVPGYGVGGPSSLRDSADLLEAYVELFADRRSGFGFTAGRAAANYGEGRLLGTPQWGNVIRGYDMASLVHKSKRARLEVLMLAPVKVRTDDFNQPNLGERIWGMYNAFPDFAGKQLLEAYALRHDQNRIGGFTGGSRVAGTDRLETNTFGIRLAGPLAAGWKYGVENAWQNGRIGPAGHRAAALFGGVSRKWMVAAKPLDFSAEYKYASGTADPKDLTRSGTFDRLSPSGHDKFGHQDLFGWMNIHNVRSLVTLGVTKAFAANVMYDNFWLASPKDALYNGSGKVIFRSVDGSAGRHVGQELDGFVTYKLGPYRIGGGYGYFFNGEAVRRMTPGACPTYVYVFSSYAF